MLVVVKQIFLNDLDFGASRLDLFDQMSVGVMEVIGLGSTRQRIQKTNSRFTKERHTDYIGTEVDPALPRLHGQQMTPRHHVRHHHVELLQIHIHHNILEEFGGVIVVGIGDEETVAQEAVLQAVVKDDVDEEVMKRRIDQTMAGYIPG